MEESRRSRYSPEQPSAPRFIAEGSPGNTPSNFPNSEDLEELIRETRGHYDPLPSVGQPYGGPSPLNEASITNLLDADWQQTPEPPRSARSHAERDASPKGRRRSTSTTSSSSSSSASTSSNRSRRSRKRKERRRKRRAEKKKQEALLLKILERLADRPASTRPRDYERPPRYNCKILTREATAIDIDDWLKAINAGNQLRAETTPKQWIEWAMDKLAYPLQTDWRNHATGSAEEPTWEEFEAFVRKQHIDPELQERQARDQLMTIAQRPDEAPMQYFARWRALRESLPEEWEDDRAAAHHYFYNLHGRLKKELERQKCPMQKARHIAQEAERLWIWIANQNGHPKRKHLQDDGEQPGKRHHSPSGLSRRGSFRRGSSSRHNSRPASEQGHRSTSGSSTPVSAPYRGQGGNRPPPKCGKCGRQGHETRACYAKIHANGNNLLVNQTPLGNRGGLPAKVSEIRAQELDSSEN